MQYRTVHERRLNRVCIKCEGTPVEGTYRCAACNAKYRDENRLKMRKAYGCVPRTHWCPAKQVYVQMDEREAYEAVRAAIALDMANGATGKATCDKYRITWPRLKKICMEYGVAFTRKRGKPAGRPKTPERLQLEANVLEDARAGMNLHDLQQKYTGYDPWTICKQAGVPIKKMEEPNVQVQKEEVS